MKVSLLMWEVESEEMVERRQGLMWKPMFYGENEEPSLVELVWMKMQMETATLKFLQMEDDYEALAAWRDEH